MVTGEPYDPFKDYKIPDIPYTPIPQLQTGWVCPKCGRVHAPWVSSCGCTFPKYKNNLY